MDLDSYQQIPYLQMSNLNNLIKVSGFYSFEESCHLSQGWHQADVVTLFLVISYEKAKSIAFTSY